MICAVVRLTTLRGVGIPANELKLTSNVVDFLSITFLHCSIVRQQNFRGTKLQLGRFTGQCKRGNIYSETSVLDAAVDDTLHILPCRVRAQSGKNKTASRKQQRSLKKFKNICRFQDIKFALGTFVALMRK